MALRPLVEFTRTLAAAGLGVTTGRTASFLAAVAEIDVADPQQLYWAGRLTLCAEPDELATYDRVFAQWFHGEPAPPMAPASRRPALVTAAPGSGGSDDGGVAVAVRTGASDVEVLRRRDLADVDAAQRAALRELLAGLRLEPPMRRSLRLRPARRGAVDPRRTVRGMLAAGGEPARLRRRRRAQRPRRVVLLVDVSGSMEPYADALLRFAHAVAHRTPRAVEAFTLGTRLTRVSRQLRLRDPDAAVAQAARAVPDYAGGTRLGETLRAFLDRWGQRGAARQAVVVLFSDGWERGDTALLAEQMRRLRRLAHTVLWVNPHAGHDGYEPVQSGIAAALPYVDRLLAGHSVQTLEQVLDEMKHCDAKRLDERVGAGQRMVRRA